MTPTETREAFAEAMAVFHVVELLRAGWGATMFCTYGWCDNDQHDHTEGDDVVPLVCGDCGLPTHYDYGLETYRHDNPNAPLCWLQVNVWGAS